MSKDRTLTEEEKKLWNQAMVGIVVREKPNQITTPLKKRPRVKERFYKPEALPERPIKIAFDPAMRQIPKNRAKKVKIEATVDLHGMTQDQAYKALQRFLISCQHQGMTWVLVITGKGSKEGGTGIGVLKAAVPQWLCQMPFLTLAAGHAPAKEHDGGTGAIYVRLKKIYP